MRLNIPPVPLTKIKQKLHLYADRGIRIDDNVISQLRNSRESMYDDEGYPVSEVKDGQSVTSLGEFWSEFFGSFYDGNKISKSRIIDFIREEFSILWVSEGQSSFYLYVYRNGYYERDNNPFHLLGMIVNNLIPGGGATKSFVSDIAYQLSTDIQYETTLAGMNTHPEHFVCFRNGVYDPIKNAILKHDSTYRFTNQIPHDFDPEKPMPNGSEIERFFDNIGFADDDRKMLLSFFGLCFTTDCRLQRFLVLKGRRGTGKSTLINLLTSAIGEENHSGVSLENLVPEKQFYLYDIVGMLLNTGPEVQTETKNNQYSKGPFDATTIKALTGQDRVKAEGKHRDPYYVKPYAKHIFGMNNYLTVDSKEEAFWRRVMMVQMNNQPQDGDIDTDLPNRLNAEIDYFIRLCMDELKEYYKLPDNEKQSIVTAKSKELCKEWQRYGDSVEAFISGTGKMDPFDGKDREKTSVMYDRYYAYCTSEGLPPRGKKNFFEAMRNKGYIPYVVNGIDFFRNPKNKNEFKPSAETETPFD